MEYYHEKFGKQNTERILPRVKGVAAEHGIEMNYGGTVGNTFDSHRLIWLAREVGGSEMQNNVVERLFKAYFVENQSIEMKEVLQDCAEDVGLGDKCNELWEDDDAGKEAVQQEKAEYGRAFQCSGVPMFVVDGKYVLNGAQEENAFLRVFGKLN